MKWAGTVYCSDAKLLSEPFYWKLIFFFILYKMAGWLDGDVKYYLILHILLKTFTSKFKLNQLE